VHPKNETQKQGTVLEERIMSKGKRRVFSREFKLSAVKRVLAGESVAALSRELGVRRGDLYRWGRHYRSGGAEALRPACRPRKGFGVLDLEGANDLVTARKRIGELERKVGQQQVELDFFRQALRQVEGARRPSDGPGERASPRSSRR
jgi:transposase-like protein